MPISPVSRPWVRAEDVDHAFGSIDMLIDWIVDELGSNRELDEGKNLVGTIRADLVNDDCGQLVRGIHDSVLRKALTAEEKAEKATGRRWQAYAIARLAAQLRLIEHPQHTGRAWPQNSGTI